MTKTLYFAYGSTMLTERLQTRCKTVRPRGGAKAIGFSLSFSKQSKDESGKATFINSVDLIEPSLKPYDWYLDLVIAGARQHALPTAYIETLATTPSICDPNPEREARIEALALLARRNTT